MQYTDVINALAYYTQQESPDPSFTAATPTMLSNTENRCYRDMQFLATNGENYGLQTTQYSNILALNQITGQSLIDGSTVAMQWPVVVEGIAAKVGNRWIAYQLTSRDWLEMTWPDLTISAAPVLGLAYFCMRDPETALLAPVPDRVYPVRVSGKWRPAPISASNPITFLWTNFPDLAFAALMVEAMGYQRAFGQAFDDPRAAMTWNTRYNDALKSALAEEALRRGQGPGYSPYSPAPLAKAAEPMPGPPPQPMAQPG